MDPTVRKKMFFVCELNELEPHIFEIHQITQHFCPHYFLGGLYKLSSSLFLHSILTAMNNLFFQDIHNIFMCGIFQGEDETYPHQTLIWFSLLFFLLLISFSGNDKKNLLLKCFLKRPDFILADSAKHVISDTNISKAFTASIPRKSSVSSESGELYLTPAL